MAARTYYPGFFAALFLVLLRIAIGWHFFYEGLYKVELASTNAPFTAAEYLRNATGPLGTTFQNLVPDRDGLQRLDLQRLTDRWSSEKVRFAQHYRFGVDQAEQAQVKLDGALAKARVWLEQSENANRIQLYKTGLNEVAAVMQNPNALRHQREAAWKKRLESEKERRELTAVVDGWEKDLFESWTGLSTAAQRLNYGSYHPAWTQLDLVNRSMILGLLVAGFCLMAGLFTRMGALIAAALLTLFYVSAPPWPGLPQSPMTEGHYLYVNKNLIELFACLAIATLPTGHWVGLDALLFGARRRRKLAALEDAESDANEIANDAESDDLRQND